MSNSILQCKVSSFGAKSVSLSVNLPTGDGWKSDVLTASESNLSFLPEYNQGTVPSA
jgi:hypothetical protein